MSSRLVPVCPSSESGLKGGLRLSESPMVAFAGGGTGGHLYPALATMDALRDRSPALRFAFLVTERAIDRRILGSVDAQVIPQSLPSLQKAPWRWPGVFRQIRRVRLDCRATFQRDRPALVVGTGGMSSVPAVLEARRARIPTVLLNPDALPGRANRYLGGGANAVFVQFHDTMDCFRRPDRVFVTGCPVRPAFHKPARRAGMERFGLRPDQKVLLITGASQGSRSINEAVFALLPSVSRIEGWQILHLTGEGDYQAACRAYEACGASGKVLAYTDAMAEALDVADLVVSRAGASTLAEITAVGRASVLVPYPFHKDQHQLANARCLARNGAARIVIDRVSVGENAPALGAALGELMRDAAAREAMAAAALRMGQGHAAARIADIILTRFINQPAALVESVKASL